MLKNFLLKVYIQQNDYCFFFLHIFIQLDQIVTNKIF